MAAKTVKRMIIMVIVLIVVFGGVFGFDAVRSHIISNVFKHWKNPPATISTGKSQLKKVQSRIHVIGSLVAVNGVDVSSEVQGIVSKILFRPGQYVEKGTLLVVLDDRVDVQTLRSNQAQLISAKANYLRNKKLFAKHLISASSYDSVVSTYKQTLAAVKKSKAMIAQKHIRAPFAGTLGLDKIDVGQFVSPGTALVSLQNQNWLRVKFSVPQQDLSQVKMGAKLEVQSDSAPGKTVTGYINAIDSTVNPDTRNIEVEGSINNQQHILYPGTFATVAVLAGKAKNQVVVPSTAVTYTLYGDTVYSLTPTKKKNKAGKLIYIAKQNYVTVGNVRNNQAVILTGLKPNLTVVTSGQLKIYNDAPVVVDNNVKLDSIAKDRKYT